METRKEEKFITTIINFRVLSSPIRTKHNVDRCVNHAAEWRVYLSQLRCLVRTLFYPFILLSFIFSSSPLSKYCGSYRNSFFEEYPVYSCSTTFSPPTTEFLYLICVDNDIDETCSRCTVQLASLGIHMWYVYFKNARGSAQLFTEFIVVNRIVYEQAF